METGADLSIEEHIVALEWKDDLGRTAGGRAETHLATRLDPDR